MPAIIELRLKATRPLVPETRQLHGLACALFEDGTSTVTHLSQDKPFSVWPLQPSGDTGQDWTLRAGWLPGTPPPQALMCLTQVRAGRVTCAVTETHVRAITHAQLAATPPASSASFTFRSPVYFAQNGTGTVLPDPRLIIASWRRNRDGWLPADHELRIGDDAGREIHRAARLADYELRTTTMDSGHGYARAGFTGTITLRLGKGTSRELATRFAAVARFAEICGTGAQTTHGFGATTLDTATSLQAGQRGEMPPGTRNPMPSL
jgi:CRISPR-associated endoribonuclease Cas6